ncbi:MAG: C10 family peptidase [Bacteroidota bacterium]|nr:C10 family peptidase [Bacteroidota bacterium]
MKKLSLLLIAVLIGAVGFARPVSEQVVERVAYLFMSQKLERSEFSLKLQMKSEQNTWYLYSDANAWVIVSGDTELYPVLAFSTASTVSEETMPPAMKSYLNARDNQLVDIRQKRIFHPENQNAWKAFSKGVFYNTRSSMEPLVETRWNQGWPYNMMCPLHSQGPGGHVYAGCVATAMSQIMKYHNYPETGRFVGIYYWGADIEVDFSEGNYEWDKMTETATTLSREAIAKLMYHCGASVGMDYDYDGSGSNIQSAADAFKYYFKYKSGSKFFDEVNFSDADWKFLLKEDLDKQHPILYRGTDDSGGGHAFVCDAYQDTSYFHFNWGWSGAGDGFFHLDDQSFHWGQGAVVNIMPYWGEYCNSMIYTQNNWSFHDGSGNNFYWNDSDCEWLINPEGAEKIQLSFSSFETEVDDILYVYDGLTDDAPLLEQFSGNEIPATITSTGNALLLRFVTDSEGQARGWYADYESVMPASADLIENELFSVYPNPATSLIAIQFANVGQAQVDLFDYTGRFLKSQIVNESEVSLDISNLPNGLYILKIRQGDFVVQKQFVKD